MRKRLIYGSGVLLLFVCAALVIWQGSFSFGDFSPSSPEQTYTLWAMSTLIFLLTVTLGFMLVRNFVKLYVERRSNREGSRIRSKLVIGALALTATPVVFLVLFSINVLNINIQRWFTRPAEDMRWDLIGVANTLGREMEEKARAQAEWLSRLPEIESVRSGAPVPPSLQIFCRDRGIESAHLDISGSPPIQLCRPPNAAAASVEGRGGGVTVRTRMPSDLARTQQEIDRAIRQYDQLGRSRQEMRRSYLLLLSLITLFILFVATWVALFLAKQISVPITALFDAAQQIRLGNFGYRIQVRAGDELATLVRAFNEMSTQLDANTRELENRRRFTEAILESIPTGVISITSDGRIQSVNRALKGLFSADQVDRAAHLEDLFSGEDTAELRYLMNRARRTGLAASQFDLRRHDKVLHLSATVAALEEKITSGFVIVLEDTGDLLRAQKAAAWHEVARRIAHEIKNPLTPISLCAERISRQLDRPLTADTSRVLRDCSSIISSEVQSLKTLVDEFWQFARFPAAQPSPADLNELVEMALGVFTGRLHGIAVIRELDASLPQVGIDREQFKRLIINLVDNAAEAMQNSPVKRLYIGTHSPTPEIVELTVADTGSGISPEAKEKLFLPYFSTKNRGTGLGLAIVHHIVTEHGGHIRVEDNQPSGARFIVEIPAVVTPEMSPDRVVTVV